MWKLHDSAGRAGTRRRSVDPVLPSPRRRSWVEQVMGLPVSVLARGPRADADRAADAVARVFDELHEVDAVFSPYRADSAVSRLGRGEIGLQDCDEDVLVVLERCRRARERTGGLFDPVRPDGTWDPSGLVKGWAVERAARHLAAATDVDWCLNAGGDVVVHCPSGQPFAVGIQDPQDATKVAAVVRRVAGAVATSGTRPGAATSTTPGPGWLPPAAGRPSRWPDRRWRRPTCWRPPPSSPVTPGPTSCGLCPGTRRSRSPRTGRCVPPSAGPGGPAHMPRRAAAEADRPCSAGPGLSAGARRPVPPAATGRSRRRCRWRRTLCRSARSAPPPSPPAGPARPSG